jgi:hypothetical protein
MKEPYQKIAKHMVEYLELLDLNSWHFTEVEEAPESLNDVQSWEWALKEMQKAAKNPKAKESQLGFFLIGKYFQHLRY